jgi:hypothetical protein
MEPKLNIRSRLFQKQPTKIHPALTLCAHSQFLAKIKQERNMTLSLLTKSTRFINDAGSSSPHRSTAPLVPSIAFSRDTTNH